MHRYFDSYWLRIINSILNSAFLSKNIQLLETWKISSSVSLKRSWVSASWLFNSPLESFWRIKNHFWIKSNFCFLWVICFCVVSKLLLFWRNRQKATNSTILVRNSEIFGTDLEIAFIVGGLKLSYYLKKTTFDYPE